jgi:hypothetical protein
MRLPILNAGGGQWVVSAFAMHDQALPPVPPVPAVPGLIEGMVNMGWPLGMLAHKTARKTLVDGAPGVQHGHDVGYFIPHMALPVNALMAVNTMFSKHKVMFPVRSVRLQGEPAGTYLFFLMGIICANPVSIPTGVLLLFRCTVWTKFNWTTVLLGLAHIALEMAVDALWNKITKGHPLGRKGGKKMINIEVLGAPKWLPVLGGYTMREMLFWDRAAGALMLRFLTRKTTDKLVDEVLKRWIFTPTVGGLPKGEAGVGRGRASKKFFDKDWW